jgi:hypothetical protein
MRHLFSLSRVIFILTGILLLSGCTGFDQNYMTNISNKNGGKLGSQATQSSGPAVKCNQWCHNGWCSNNCEADAPKTN